MVDFGVVRRASGDQNRRSQDSPHVQTQGSLEESDLASLLQTVQSERATGTLSLEAGEEICSLFFLFGHLFHATGPDGDGEAVVLRALSWTGGNYRFDRRAKLPAKQTVTSSPAELIAAAEEADQPAAGGVGDGAGSTSETSTWNPVASGNSPDSSESRTAPGIDARYQGRNGQLLAGHREPPLFPPSPSPTAPRSRRQSGDGRRSG
jgi:Domain of unknown function (DUF4388)